MAKRSMCRTLLLGAAVCVWAGPLAAQPELPAQVPVDLTNDLLEAAALLLWVFFFGVIGGFVSELLTLRGRIEWPHRTEPDEALDGLDDAVARYVFDLGILARLFIGGCAALLVLWVLDLDEEGVKALVGGSILAGAAGGAVFQSLRGRLEAALAAKELAQNREVVSQLAGKVEELADAKERLKSKIATESVSPVGSRAYSFSTPVELDLPELERLDALVGEARALSGMALRGAGEPSRVGVLRVLAAWSGVPLADVGPDSKKIADVWLQNRDRPQLQDTHLALLIEQLEGRFPAVGLRLRPDDLAKGAVTTVGALIGHVEQRVARRRP